MIFSLPLLLSFLTASAAGGSPSTYESDEAILRSSILEGYDTSSRPLYDHTKPVNVTVDLVLQHIIDVYWKDEFLKWNASKYNSLSKLKVKPKKVWIPDICLYNSLAPAIYAKDMTNFHVEITNEGDVQWLAPIIVESVCRYNVRYFPFDTQVCNIQLASWTYNGFELDVSSKYQQGDLRHFHNDAHVEWHSKGFPVTKVINTYNCCPEPYPLIQYSLILKREPNYYVFYLFLPAIVITIASLFSFYLPPGCETKVDLAVSGLLSKTVFLLLISDLMPPDAHNPPLLGLCLTVLLITQALAVVLNVIINRLHDDVIHKDEPPKYWVLKLAHYLKYPLLLWHIDYMKPYNKPRKSFEAVVLKSKMQINSTISLPSGVETTVKLNEPFKPVDTLGEQLNEILLHLHKVSERSEQRLAHEKIADQWRNIIVLYDRILMIIFIIGIVAITVWFMTLSPPESNNLSTELSR